MELLPVNTISTCNPLPCTSQLNRTPFGSSPDKAFDELQNLAATIFIKSVHAKQLTEDPVTEEVPVNEETPLPVEVPPTHIRNKVLEDEAKVFIPAFLNKHV